MYLKSIQIWCSLSKMTVFDKNGHFWQKISNLTTFETQYLSNIIYFLFLLFETNVFSYLISIASSLIWGLFYEKRDFNSFDVFSYLISIAFLLILGLFYEKRDFKAFQWPYLFDVIYFLFFSSRRTFLAIW